jgi:hypothetical protein
MNAIVITLTLSDDDCLNMRLALNMTACEWGDKAMEHRQRGEPVDADTCERLRAKYHALWERVHAAQRLAEAEARADDMFASEARDPCGVARDDDVIVAHGGASVWKAPRSGRDPADVLNAIDSLKGW